MSSVFKLRAIPTLQSFLREADDDEQRKKAEQPSAAKAADVKDEPDVDLGKMFEPKADQPLAKADQPKAKQDGGKSSGAAPDIAKASREKTKQALRGITPTDQMRDMLGRINVPDELVANEPDVDTDADTTVGLEREPQQQLPRPVNPNAVPATISRAIAAWDPKAINPEFHQVKNLPGYMQRPIRALGRAVFSAFTNTPVEDISVVANLGGQGPNSDREVAGVAKWLATNARKVDQSSMDFGNTIPGYEAETLLYSTNGMRFLVVRDFAGGYIYAWSEGSSGREIKGPEAQGNDDSLEALMLKYGV